MAGYLFTILLNVSQCVFIVFAWCKTGFTMPRLSSADELIILPCLPQYHYLHHAAGRENPALAGYRDLQIPQIAAGGK